MKLSERLKELRTTNNLLLRELRDRIQEATGDVIALSYLASLEKEDRTPSVETLTKIAAGYGMTLRELLGTVVLPGALQPQYSPALEEVAKERRMSDAEKEELYQFEFRGKRPETKEDWDLLYTVLKGIEKRGA